MVAPVLPTRVSGAVTDTTNRDRSRSVVLLLSGILATAVALTACGGVGPRSMSAEVLGLSEETSQEPLALVEDDRVTSSEGDVTDTNSQERLVEVNGHRVLFVPPGCQALPRRFVCREAQLQGYDFRGWGLLNADFSGADLTGALFDNAELWNADFREATLSGTSFVGADLLRADFTGADAHDSDFRGANLNQGRFSSVNARGANFTGASMDVFTLVNTEFSGATWIDGQPCEEVYGYFALRCYRFSDHAGDDYRSLIEGE